MMHDMAQKWNFAKLINRMKKLQVILIIFPLKDLVVENIENLYFCFT